MASNRCLNPDIALPTLPRVSIRHEMIESLSENRLREGDSPILLRGLRKIGTVPDGSRIGSEFDFCTLSGDCHRIFQ